MSLTVSLNRVGILRANDILHQARNDAARRHEVEPQTVSVEVARSSERLDTRTSEAPAGQSRIVDLRI